MVHRGPYQVIFTDGTTEDLILSSLLIGPQRTLSHRRSRRVYECPYPHIFTDVNKKGLILSMFRGGSTEDLIFSATEDLIGSSFVMGLHSTSS